VSTDDFWGVGHYDSSSGYRAPLIERYSCVPFTPTGTPPTVTYTRTATFTSTRTPTSTSTATNTPCGVMAGTVITSPNCIDNVEISELYAVTAISANDAWAVGRSRTSTLTLHWNGS